DEALHLRIPAARLVAEVDAGLQQFFHGDDGHASPFLIGLGYGAPAVSRRRPARAPATVRLDPSAGSRVGNRFMVATRGRRGRPGAPREAAIRARAARR